ncbi:MULTISPECIES: hypothetical protein [Methylobacterium]|uniref:hypothetical protein n=1 Tax=Methylobacterium TaxID=407 RepID=UPI0013ECED7D|nr:hypothetical protein [Methylobacterium sp. DB0501]NGM34346.1 hypothetical protein [Methylobacterium sp. DB0501]
MASSPSIASTRIPATASPAKALPTEASTKPGMVAAMLRLWLEHNRRVAQFGMPPL